MKLLLLFAHDYWLRPYERSLPDAPEAAAPVEAQSAVVALVHVEPGDPERGSGLVTKAGKQIKWLAGKFGSKSVVLHSFAHLAAARAEPQAAEALLLEIRDRLAAAGYRVETTPFGWFNEFRIHVGGPSLAKVFVEL
jgi:threonyl-tRNA synthetase editing subunit